MNPETESPSGKSPLTFGNWYLVNGNPTFVYAVHKKTKEFSNVNQSSISKLKQNIYQIFQKSTNC